jgi:hypothetical protein
MTLRPGALAWGAVVLMSVALVPATGRAQKATAAAPKADAPVVPELIWRDPGDMASLDLVNGAGGRAHAPDRTATFTFVSEDPIETSPKFDIVDSHDVKWKVKLGAESQAEVAATRLLWAAGYFVDEDYYLPTVTVQGLPALKRGQEFVSAGGIVRGARLERKLSTVKKLGNWDWFDNPFLGQRELNGLRVMMSLLNNWDLKTINNSIYAVAGEDQYVVSDAGATFGNTGNSITRSKGVPKDYEDSAFIAKNTPEFIDFVLHSRPFFTGIFEATNYRERTKMEEITKHIPRADAQWLGQRLSRLTDEQIRDAFRASGFDTADVEQLTQTVRQRITALGVL